MNNPQARAASSIAAIIVNPETALLSADQASKILGCSVGTVRNLFKSGELHAIRFGTKNKTVRVHREDVERFIADKRRA